MKRAFQEKHQIFKILEIIGDRHTNFEDPMLFIKRPVHIFHIEFLKICEVLEN